MRTDETILLSGPWLLLFSFALGTIWGSFLNVCIYRLPAGKSIVFPGSHCGVCGMSIRWYDNIPILSYFLLRGICRSCGAHFSARYVAVEALTGALFAGIFWRYGLALGTILHWVLVCLLIVGSFTDIDHFIIPDGVTLGGLAFAVVASGWLGSHSFVYDEARALADHVRGSFLRELLQWPRADHFVALVGSMLGGTFAWAMLWAISVLGRIAFGKEAMGGGDVKLFAFLGAYFGMLGAVVILFLSAMIGSVVGLTLLVLHKVFSKDEYEDVVFDLGKARKPPYAGESGSACCGGSACELPPGEAPAPQASPRTIRIARRTARQLHHFPYGPYIAVAAVVVLFTHSEIQKWVWSYLWLVEEVSW